MAEGRHPLLRCGSLSQYVIDRHPLGSIGVCRGEMAMTRESFGETTVHYRPMSVLRTELRDRG